ncbi:hypothetical protein B0T22DRAFT_148458 [Podospora appendiculata]|uniref:Uncharacterized protein n=1 Tax=Podospora appendiculata TaxID=314037 RepID=A0AAE0X9D7_9PEZI|nr:hypothetical protein B0T22DRAFT_148458 [Podospora appendiculata]
MPSVRPQASALPVLLPRFYCRQDVVQTTRFYIPSRVRMTTRRQSQLGLLVAILTCLTVVAALQNASTGGQVDVVEADIDLSQTTWPRYRRRMTGDGRGPAPTTTTALTTETLDFIGTRTATSPLCVVTGSHGNLRRGQTIDMLATISSLSSALASADASVVSVSRELQSSVDNLAASASSAVLEAQASAADLVSSAQESASAAAALASSAIRSATAAMTRATSAVQAADSDLAAAQGAAISIANASVAVVASAVGSSLLSFLGVFLFARFRRAKRKRREEEQDLSAALDRAVVSYIVNELPACPPNEDPLPSGGGAAPDNQEIEYDIPGTPRSRLSARASSIADALKYSLRTVVSAVPTPITSPRKRERSVYGDILAQPLEAAPVAQEKPPGITEQSRRHSNWPLPKDGWL